ncbi:MAG TPA: MFS transporter [Candidatus Lachnoclostridium pullistercoris]|uniref:MFS transporter n=1 Tax=Candidatus Lachnoclostridium pullistercoris TaxID=2838632 RepID=A0A9D2PET7_9FIRM|nr:MFS transporter [Candidatus Lachnoclostridium pullistercoris]
MGRKSSRLHYAWKIMIACMCIKMGSAGALTVAMGNFVTPVVKDLNCEVSSLTMFVSIQAMSMAFMYTIASKILMSRKIGRVMGIASVAEVSGLALMSSYHSPYMFYLSGLITGVAQAFTGYVAIPTVINMWFKKKAGTVLGMVIAVGSAAGIFYNMLSARLIVVFGWRAAYMILALIAAVVTIPAVFLIIKTPRELGLSPYGEEAVIDNGAERKSAAAESGYGITLKQAFHSGFFYLAWFACILISYASGVSGYTATYTTMELEQSIAFGSAAGICVNVGTIISSIVLGRLNDKLGVRAGLIWGAGTAFIGYSIMLLSRTTPMLVLPGAFIVGLGASMYAVQCPLLAKKIVGDRHYSQIWSWMMMANSLIGGGLYSSIGMFYDKFGSYKGTFIMAIILYAGAMMIGMTALSVSERNKRREFG